MSSPPEGPTPPDLGGDGPKPPIPGWVIFLAVVGGIVILLGGLCFALLSIGGTF